MRTPIQNKIVNEIFEERFRQDIKFGSNRVMPPLKWLPILMEEVGEVSTEIIEMTFACDPQAKGRYREELVQVAAVCIAMLESHDNT